MISLADGKIVRKDLTKKIKEGANVPVYVLEFLLGQYCSSDDESIIEKGVQNVKHILADNFVRPDESQKILSQLRKKGSHTIIDMVTVCLDMKKDCFFAEFSNLGVGNVPIADEYPEKFDRLLCGGIWCIVQLDYEVEGDNNFGIEDIDGNPLRSKQKKQKDISPISIRKLTPIQMPHVDIDELKQGRKAFTKDEWLPGNGKIERTGLGSDSKCKEAVNTAFNYLKANDNRISGSISTTTKDYIINYQDLQGIGMTDKLALPTLKLGGHEWLLRR